ncbi:MAG TPA: hypothetical protein VHH73_18775 [Verrucomicrobiae bacterium]|nr:hypothetical protein [Verrucomicrobiae bacterium]
MNLTCDDIIPILRSDFSKLWNCKPRGNSVEIITPFATATDKFVSVFVTSRNDEFVVTDAGWLDAEDNFYSTGESDEMEFEAVLKHFMGHFGVSIFFEKSGRQFYFKRVLSRELLSSAVYDMANFVVSVVNWTSLPKETSVEAQHRMTFHRKAKDFIKISVTSLNNSTAFETPVLRTNYRLEDLPGARFNIAVQYSNAISLICFVTGSTQNRFYSDFTKAIVNFELTESTKFKDFVRKRVAFINDEAEGYSPARTGELYRLLGTHNGKSVKWSERDVLMKHV